jgi:cell wall-associated NlpC family hydrolase
MKSFMLLMSGLIVLAGCRPAPRYNTPEKKEPGNDSTLYYEEIYYSEKPADIRKKARTHDLIELGRIIQSYLGKPSRGSSRREKGMDCSEFTMVVFEKFNETMLPRTAAKQSKVGYKVGRHEIRYGDLVFFNTEGARASHVGIYIGNDEFVHASSSSGVIISSLNEKYWRRCFVGARRILF